MPHGPTSISSQTLTHAIAGAGDNDVVRVRDGKIATARQSFFGRVLRLFPTSARETRERRVEAETITHSLLVELKQQFDSRAHGGEDIAEAALHMVGLGAPGETPAGRNTPITVRKIREAHACARLLSDRAKRSTATLAAISYAPAAPGFGKFARDLAGVEPERLTGTQRTHYQYMLQRHVAIEPGRYAENRADLQKLAVRALKYVSRMSDGQIEAAQNDTLAQRKAAAAVLDDLTRGSGVSSLAANLDRLHDASHLGIADAMLGDAEYGAFMTLDTLALERAAAMLTPQQAREAYFRGMASNGTGRAVLAALGEKADELGRRSRQSTSPNSEMQLELGAKRALELQSTAHIVLKTLGERGGVENVEQQLRDSSRMGAERTKAASGAIAVVGSRLDRAVAQELIVAQKPPQVSAGEGILIPIDDEQLRTSLQEEDRVPATRGELPVREVKGSSGEAAEFFGNGFYQDMNRMHIMLAGDRTQTRIGMVAPSDLEPTEAEKEAARLEGLERLVEFVGDETLAARVTRLIGQNLFAPMSLALEKPDGPVKLADGTHGQIQPVRGSQHRSISLAKTDAGEIHVHVAQSYPARAMTTPDSIRELDGKRSYVRMSFDFSITRDTARATSPVTYDFRLAEAQ
ncbi:MAG TPA: hypothetical protein VK624_18795 [Steroidobacteraceae bacterium]|nr:hypothetical protein [Steroidobacteraceae bacterium]